MEKWGWTAKKTIESVLNKGGVKGGLLHAVKARKLTYYGHTMRKQGSCLEKEIMQETMPGVRRRGRPHEAWMDNISTWTGLPVEESIKMTEDRDNGESTSVVWPTLGSRTAKQQNRVLIPVSNGTKSINQEIRELQSKTTWHDFHGLRRTIIVIAQ